MNIPNFKLEASSDSLVLENDEDLKFYREISNEYSTVDFLVVLFTPKKPLFDPETIKKYFNFSVQYGDILYELSLFQEAINYYDYALKIYPYDVLMI